MKNDRSIPIRLLIILLSILIGGSAMAAAAADIYVAPGGSDAAPGTKDQPLATLERARVRVRELKRAGAMQGPIRVILRGGTYQLKAPFVLSPEDSGTAASPVVYTALGDEKPILSGGRAITGWQPGKIDGRACWVADLAAQGLGGANFKELFAGGERRPRTRLPKTDYFRFDPATPKHTWQSQPESARFVKGDLKAWDNLGNVELVVLNRWFDNHEKLSRIDEAASTVYFAPRASRGLYDSKNLPVRYWVENVREALDTPGQWYLDRPANKLYYLPLPGETPDKIEAVVPVLESLLAVGDVLEGKEGNDFRERSGRAPAAKVEHVRFEHLTLRHAESQVPFSAAQAAVSVPAAVALRGAEDCAFYDCAFEALGGYAVQFQDGCADCRVVACRFTDLGAGAVRIERGSAHTTVADCTILHCGRIWLQACGVLIRDSACNRVAYNEIGDLEYTGVSLGWTWGYAPTQTADNRIEYNHIHHLGGDRLEDMGGIYSLGAQPGSVLRGNVIHDVNSYNYGAWGLYTDEGSSYMLLEGNLAYRTRMGGFHQHYGRDNIVRNNIFALAATQALQKSRVESIRPFIFEKNIVYVTPEAKLLGGNWREGHYIVRDSLFWREGGGPLDFEGKTLEQWQADGRGAGCIIVNAGLKDPAGGDFSLAPDSPALKLGFKPIDPAQAGPRKLDPRKVEFNKWPGVDETQKIIIEPRLETEETLARRGGGRFDGKIELTAQKSASVIYTLTNRGPLPGKGEVAFKLDPAAAAKIEGETTLKYDLKPGEKTELRFKVLAPEGGKPAVRLDATPASGEGLFASALFFN